MVGPKDKKAHHPVDKTFPSPNSRASHKTIKTQLIPIVESTIIISLIDYQYVGSHNKIFKKIWAVIFMLSSLIKYICSCYIRISWRRQFAISDEFKNIDGGTGPPSSALLVECFQVHRSESLLWNKLGVNHRKHSLTMYDDAEFDFWGILFFPDNGYPLQIRSFPQIKAWVYTATCLHPGRT